MTEPFDLRAAPKPRQCHDGYQTDYGYNRDRMTKIVGKISPNAKRILQLSCGLNRWRWWYAVVAVVGMPPAITQFMPSWLQSCGATNKGTWNLVALKLPAMNLHDWSCPIHVRSISLRDSAITDKGTDELNRGLNLERVDLTNTQITDAALEDLKQMPRLWVVDVAAPNVSPETFGKIRFFVEGRSSSIKRRCYFAALPRLPVPAETAAPIGPAEATPAKNQVRQSGYAKEIESLDGELQLHLDFSHAAITGRRPYRTSISRQCPQHLFAGYGDL